MTTTTTNTQDRIDRMVARHTNCLSDFCNVSMTKHDGALCACVVAAEIRRLRNANQTLQKIVDKLRVRP